MRQTTTIVFVLLLCVAALLTRVIGGTVADFHKSDAAGQGLATAYTFFEAILLTVLLAVLLLMGAANGGLRGISGAVAPVLYASAISALFMALRILEKLADGDRFQWRLRVVAEACPWLLILYSAWSFFPGARDRIPGWVANLGIGVPLVVLASAAWMAKGPTNAASAARQQAFAEARRREEALVAEIKALPDNNALADFLRYTEVPSIANVDVRGAALARMSKLSHRQTEAETLLQQQDTRILRILSDLDLQMTPRLCEGARTSLTKAATELRPATPTTTFEDKLLDPYTINIRWLLENKCDCKAEVDGLEQTIRMYPESFERKRTLDYLDYLLGKPNPYGRQ
ncbi:MAG TPA: hypothetical protein VJA94_01615 [Candidatus Angelobacter sp.]